MRRFILFLTLASVLAIDANAKNMYIPAAGVTPGLNGTFWRTDLRIYNPSSEHDLDVSLHFLPTGMDGQNIPGRVFHVAKRGTLVLDNVVTALWPETSAFGAIRIDSDADLSYPFVASSRTYTNSPDAARPGTYGQFVPALDPSEARTTTVLLHASSRPEFRTNAGVMNPFREPVQVTMKIVGTDGIVYAQSSARTVPAMSMQQWSLSDLFGGVFFQDAVIVVEATAPVFSWASVVDNFSGDAIFVRGIENDDRVTPLP